MALFSGLPTPKWMSPDEESWQSTQQGHAMAQLYQEGMRLGMEQQRLPYELAGQALNLQRNQNLLAADTEAKKGQVELSKALADIAKSGGWADPKSRASVFDVGARYPALLDTPIWKQTQDNFEKADRVAADAAHWKAVADSQQERLDLMQDRIDLDRDKLELSQNNSKPQEFVVGKTHIWYMPGSKMFHVETEKGATAMSTKEMLEFYKTLPDDDPNKKSIGDFLAKKATEATGTASTPGAPAAMPPASKDPDPLGLFKK